ncbi:MAG: YbjQ family protein [Elusimicrobiaceae bacterium]|nr:YbjQ family protein [Elusimicrobiaceae bacterium]MBT3954757.1 YbjQ family protein [Elusimicrobiaceae bacterium]MBT4008062.1 YbjQ family protein [Elusimicrobiaceae bacterium]MBT4402621.1 YbjQ family protein [Elusimicrobiaceae bacterium]MBT4439495.1 YbjQ family protein [Elusimicrobiaceae bacterium]
MILTNIETVPGKQIVEHYGMVYGSTVRTKHMFADIGAGIKNMFGGELRSYTDLLEKSRQQAMKRLKNEAQKMGANAVVNVRFTTSTIAAGASEILIYGTAVKVQ